MGDDYSNIFKNIDALNPYACFLEDSTLSKVDKWIDTGCMALNAIISGSLYGGVPEGRITGFSGPSQTGKSYIVNKILANAQKSGKYPVVFDSEIALDPSTARNAGLDPKRVKYYPIDTVESCRNQLFALLDSIEKNPTMFGKFIVAIDSIGNLASQKELTDAEKGKEAGDMGLRAKSLKSMLRVLTYKAAASGTTILIVNHTYDDPAAMYPTLVKKQAGGSGPVYMSSVLVQLSNKFEKQDEGNKQDVMLTSAKSYSGTRLRALTTKNRFIPPFLETDMYLNFKTGFDKHGGLLEIAVGLGVIIQTGSTYQTAEGKKLGYFGTWKDDNVFWDTYIIPNLEPKVQQAFKYGVSTPVVSPVSNVEVAEETV